MARFERIDETGRAVTLDYVDEGDGAPIILVHGFASNRQVNWQGTGWIRLLREAGQRVIAFDNRGHGASSRFHEVEDYAIDRFVDDVFALADHRGLGRFALMGYSMGARIAVFCALRRPDRIARLLLGGLAYHLVDRAGLPQGVVEAMLAASADAVADAGARSFRVFAEATKSDLGALAACIVGVRQAPSREAIGALRVPTLITVGTRDAVAGDPDALAALMPMARVVHVEGRDHNQTVGDKVHKAAVLAFLRESAD